MMMEILTVFLPCWQVMRHQSLRQETLDSIAQWESKNRVADRTAAKSVRTASTRVESVMSGWKSVRSNNSGESILTMSALEHVLERNPLPLLEFSALRDFSGENIAFLTSVAEWKSSFPAAIRMGGVRDPNARELVRERFHGALRIYAGFISTSDAEFPINISSPDLKRLEAVFEAPARLLYGERRRVDPATPFDDAPGRGFADGPAASAASCDGSETTVAAQDRVQFWGDIPDAFDETVFDDAEQSIKYLVLTNTWPKFVRQRRTSATAPDAEAGHDGASTGRDRRRETTGSGR